MQQRVQHGMAFIEAATRSNEEGNRWVAVEPITA
jgi:hypothetical protein